MRRGKKKKKRNNLSPFRMEPVVPAAPVVAVAAVGGAGAPPPMEAAAGSAVGTKEPLLGMMLFSSKNEGRIRSSFISVEGQKAVGEFAPVGRLSDSSITYVGKIDESLGENTTIIFYKLELEYKEVGKVTFYFKRKEPDVLHLESIDASPTEIGKGYGKRMLSAVMDLARRAGRTKVSLDSYPSAVSFYLQANPPFAFNEPSNEEKYTERYAELMDEKINKKTARRKAGKVFENGNDGVYYVVPMTAKLLRKSRRANRRKGTRKRR